MDQKITEELSQYKKIILVWGGTGGHIQPIVSLIENLIQNHIFSKWNFVWIWGNQSSEEKTAKEEWIDFYTIPTLKLHTTRSFKVLLYPLILIKGIFATIRIIRWLQGKDVSKTCIFSKGGPGSVAVGFAAWILHIDLYIHESDTIPGRSNKLLGMIAKRIFLGFQKADSFFQKRKTIIVWQIIHPIFTNIGKRNSEKYPISWTTKLPHVLVICGSQWSQVIFKSIQKQFANHRDFEWIISLWKLNRSMKKEFDSMKHFHAVEWISQENIASLLSETDLAITRWSATTLAEIEVFWVKKIIIPLPYAASNHQYYNAVEYERWGDIILEQKNISKLSQIISQLISHEYERK